MSEPTRAMVLQTIYDKFQSVADLFDSRFETVMTQIHGVRDDIARYDVTIRSMDTIQRALELKVNTLETKIKFASATVAAIVSAALSLVANLIIWLITRG